MRASGSIILVFNVKTSGKKVRVKRSDTAAAIKKTKYKISAAGKRESHCALMKTKYKMMS